MEKIVSDPDVVRLFQFKANARKEEKTKKKQKKMKKKQANRIDYLEEA